MRKLKCSVKSSHLKPLNRGYLTKCVCCGTFEACGPGFLLLQFRISCWTTTVSIRRSDHGSHFMDKLVSPWDYLVGFRAGLSLIGHASWSSSPGRMLPKSVISSFQCSSRIYLNGSVLSLDLKWYAEWNRPLEEVATWSTSGPRCRSALELLRSHQGNLLKVFHNELLQIHKFRWDWHEIQLLDLSLAPNDRSRRRNAPQHLYSKTRSRLLSSMTHL